MTEGQNPIKEYETGNNKQKRDINKIKSSDKLSVEYKYKKGENQKEYANRTMYITLCTGEIKEKKVTEDMEKKFTGDSGFAGSTGIKFILLSRKEDKKFNCLDKVVDYFLSW